MTMGGMGFAGARAIGEEENRAVVGVLSRRTLYRGAGLDTPFEVQEGERELAAALGRRYALLMNSGTSALLTALAVHEIGEGDEVILPGYGWLTDLSVILHQRAVPVFAPIRDDLTIDATRIRECISGRTRAILPVHACGRPYDALGVDDAARRAGVSVIEDACQGLGARVGGVPAGRLGTVSALSFQAFKVVSSGEGGALLTDDERVYTAAVRFHDAGLRRFAHQGSRPPNATEEPIGVGLNLRMSELTAAVVRVQLRRLAPLMKRLHEARRALLAAVDEAFQAGALRGVTSAPNTEDNGSSIVLRAADPRVARSFRDVWARHGYPVRLASDARLHALPGWLDYLRQQRASHRVVDREATDAVLSRTLILDVNWEQTEPMLEDVRMATSEALSMLG